MADILSTKFLHVTHSLSSTKTTALRRRLRRLLPGEKSRRRHPKDDDTSSSSSSSSAAERGLQLVFMEELMIRARNRDAVGVDAVIYDMIVAGLSPGPRSYHGLFVAHVLNGDNDGVMQSLRRELSVGLVPLHETFLALVRLFGSKGHAIRGLEILAAMEKLNYDIRKA